MLLLKLVWPALLPICIYVVWCVVRARRKARGEQVKPLSTYTFIMVLSSLLIGALCLLILGAEQGKKPEGNYRPAMMENGKLVEGHFE